MTTVAIVQARTASKRLPNKVMKPIQGTPMIGLLLKRLSKARFVDQIIVATTSNSEDLVLKEYVESIGFICEQGSEHDVLNRYFTVAAKYRPDLVVRITGDCPVIDPTLVDLCIEELINTRADIVSNANPPSYPDGLDVAVFRLHVLQEAHRQTSDKYDREHVTPYMYRSHAFAKRFIHCSSNYSGFRWTVDEPEDFDVIANVFKYFSPNIHFTWEQVLALQSEKPEIFHANQVFVRNEGALLGTGQKLWRRAKRVIPGGNMLLSKRSEMFLPGKWPAYFSKARGCRVWDLDENEYIDMSIMGIGTNTLGYGHSEVDAAVMRAVQTGNMSTFNCPEEVYLAEKLIELHPWADMARFARSGGEANTIAIRIARAASGRDNIAVCGYHGWHDWYLSANLGDEKRLDGHLLPGLEPNGVPRKLKDTIFTFNYNKFDELKAIVDAHSIGVIKMEVVRNVQPVDNFLHKVRELASDKGIVLVFDECTSGFREAFGGIHLKYNVEPDMAIFGKALGNGYAITAIIGRREVMQSAQSTFISSTFWTERIGPSAGLKTLEVMEREKSWEAITKTGYKIKKTWNMLAQKHNISISISGLSAILQMRFLSKFNLAYKTIITQEMLKRGYLASNLVYVCTEHSSEILDGYFEALDYVFGLISQCEQGRSVDDLLDGELCHSGFKRLN